MKKSKVSPVKTNTIPNLELSGAALLVRLLKYLCLLDFLQTLPVYASSDIKVVLTGYDNIPVVEKPLSQIEFLTFRPNS